MYAQRVDGGAKENNSKTDETTQKITTNIKEMQ